MAIHEGIGANLRKRVGEILSVLDSKTDSIEEADIPGYRLHPLSGDRPGVLESVRVTGNWRVTFRFQDGRAEDVNLEDYH